MFFINLKIFIVLALYGHTFVKSQNCSVASSSSAGHQFAVGYSGAEYSVTFCKDPFHNFTWNRRFNNGSKTELAYFVHNETHHCMQQRLMEGHSANCSQINQTCYWSSLTITRQFQKDLDQMYLSISFDGFDIDCYSAPGYNIIVKECGTDDDLRVEVEPSSTMDRICGYECNASLSCAHGCSQDLINATCLFNATWSSTPNCVCTEPSGVLSGGAIAGIVIGCLLAVVVLAVGFVLWRKNKLGLSMFSHHIFETST